MEIGEGGTNQSGMITHYGKEVNYTVGDSVLQSALDKANIKWKLFHVDNNRIYLISSDYVPIEALPYATNGTTITTNKPIKGDSNYARAAQFGTLNADADGVMQDYVGSARVADNVKYLNKSYFDYLTTNNSGNSSTNANMKAVAYMLDTKAWEKYKDSNNKADFIIGGPTVELLMASYNQKYGDVADGKAKYQARASSLNGYQISQDYGENWAREYNILDTTDSLYINDTGISNAFCYWLASPAHLQDRSVMVVHKAGTVCDSGCASPGIGFRPIVSLKSGVELELETDGNSLNIK